MLRPFIVISFLTGTSAALAEPVPLGGDALKALSGSMVELDTPLGTKLPIRFGNDGLVSAEAGELAPLLGSAKDRGRWWVDGDRLCSKFFRWFDAETRCITVSRDGTRLYWKKDDGETGTATLIEAVRPAPPQQVAAAAPPAKPAPAAAAAPKPEINAPKPAAEAAAEEADIPAPVRKISIVTASVTPVAVPTLPIPAADPREELASDQPMMRFGGAGLLEASARLGLEQEPAGLAVHEPQKIARAAIRTVPMGPIAAGTPVAALPSGAKKPLAQTRALGVQKVAGAQPEKVRGKQRGGPAEPLPLYMVRGVDEDDVLNVRSGPSDQHALVGTIPPTGRRLELTGTCRNQWCPIRYGGASGWVHGYYLAEETSRQASSSVVYFAKP